jgi:hypothetical protein
MLQTCMLLLREAPTLSPTTIPTMDPTPSPTVFSTDSPTILPSLTPNRTNTSVLQQVFTSLPFNGYLTAAVIFTGGIAVFYFVKYKNPINYISDVANSFDNRYDGYSNLETSTNKNLGEILVSRIEDEHGHYQL